MQALKKLKQLQAITPFTSLKPKPQPESASPDALCRAAPVAWECCLHFSKAGACLSRGVEPRRPACTFWLQSSKPYAGTATTTSTTTTTPPPPPPRPLLLLLLLLLLQLLLVLLLLLILLLLPAVQSPVENVPQATNSESETKRECDLPGRQALSVSEPLG